MSDQPYESALTSREPVPGTRVEAPRENTTEDADFTAWKAQRAQEKAQRDESENASGAQKTDPMLRTGNSDQTYSQPAEREYGEGVKTGPPLDHYVHLADGSVIEGHAGGTVYHDAEKGLIPIVRVFPKG